jgi:hypothetical protein
MTEPTLDPILLRIVSRGMKDLYMNHARKQGASEEDVARLNDMDWRVVCQVVGILYGEPDLPKEKENDR